MSIDEIFKAIQILKFTELQSYLRNTTWKRIELPKNDLALFQKEIGNKFYEAILPLNKDYADYKYRIVDVLSAIAKSEDREIDQVITDLTMPPADIVRFRVINRDTVGGTISLLDGFNLLESAKKALYTTACDIIQPEKYHKRLALKGAQQFIEECRLGQTEKGSFIAALICPFVNETFDDKAQQLSIFNNEQEFNNSLTRKVTAKMMTALQTIKSAIDNAEENRIIDAQDSIISANFIESLIELNPIRENSEIEIATQWSIFAKEKILPGISVKLSSDYIPVFESLVSKMKPIDEGIDDVFIGKISVTKAEPDHQSRTEGEVILNYIMGNEEKVSKAKVILPVAAYDKACEAHKNGNTVKIKGKLISSGRTKIIQNPSFEVIE